MAMVIEDPKSMISKRQTQEAYSRTGKKAPAILAKYLAQWWWKVEQDAKALCLAYGCYDTGTLFNSIRVVARDEAGDLGQNYEKVIDVDPALDRILVAGGEEYINPRTKLPCNYAQAVHDGHLSSNGRFIPARPFLADAVRNNIMDLQRIYNEFGMELENEWLKDI
jgi:hypothetical protein